MHKIVIEIEEQKTREVEERDIKVSGWKLISKPYKDQILRKLKGL